MMDWRSFSPDFACLSAVAAAVAASSADCDQTGTITPFVLPDSPAIHTENSAAHTHTHTLSGVSKSDILREK